MGLLKFRLLIRFLRASNSDLAQPLPLEFMRKIKGESASSLVPEGEVWREE
jgi:hypothetical protein